jgi:flagellar hook-associated protein 1 FlgK
MLGLFGTLNLASRSLQTQMAGVEIAGQNLANANNPAYSRQRVNLQTNPDIMTGVGPEGTGISVLGIDQIVDKLLNGQITNQASSTGYWEQMQSALETAQTSLNEFLDTTQSASGSASTSAATTSAGLSDQLSAFFNAMQAVASSPTSISARQALIGQAQTLASSFNQINTRFDNLRNALNDTLQDQVGSTNQLLTDIAQLNDEISNAENYNGGVANDLRDQRQQKLEQLGKFMNFQTSAGTGGAVNISVNGGAVQLVSGNQVVSQLQATDPGGTGAFTISTVVGNTALTSLTGSMGAIIDARDNTLATMQTEIKNLASNLITQVNTLHSAGFSLTGSTGANFFSGTDASDIAVNQSLVDDPSLIQASGAFGDTGDNSVALALAQLANAAQGALNNQTFSDFYGHTVAKLGNALRNSNTQASNQNAVANMLANQRSSVSGVNLDEEMTNLMLFQRAYEASAHVVSTVDEMIQTVLTMKSS